MQCRSGEFLCWMRARQRWGLWKISRRIFGVISIRAGNVCIRWWNIIDSSNGFFMYFFLGSISLLFFILRLRQKKAEFKDETEKFYPNFLHLFVAIFFMLVLYIV